jgi:hypothetical protein
MDEKLNLTDLFNGDKVSSGVRIYNVILLSLVIILIALLIHFLAKPPTYDKLSVGRTELPLQSHLYRTNDYPTEMQTSVWPTYLDVPRNSCSGATNHLEPWDLWNPPKCGGRWFNG